MQCVRLSPWVLSLSLIVCAANLAPGKTISINFGANLDASTSVTLLPDEIAGVVPVGNWNNVKQGFPGGPPDGVVSYPDLIVDTDGVASGSGVNAVVDFDDLSAHVGGVVTDQFAPIDTPNRKLMQNYADVLGPSSAPTTDGTSVLFTNLDGFGPFNLVIYSAGNLPPGAPDRVARYDFRDGTSASDPLIVSRFMRNQFNPFNVPNDEFIEGFDDGTPQGTNAGNYFVVKNLNPASGSLFIFGDALLGGPSRGAINGIQLTTENVGGTNTTGDYNGDGNVNAADYVVWRDTLGQSATPPGSGADGSGNGAIDQADYEFWIARFGNTVPGAGAGLSSAVVPEPSSLGLLLVLTSVGLGKRRSRGEKMGTERSKDRKRHWHLIVLPLC